MKRLLPLALLSLLLLSGCGSGETDDNGGALESMFGSDTDEGDPTMTPGEVPYSEGPSEIPSDLVPNE